MGKINVEETSICCHNASLYPFRVSLGKVPNPVLEIQCADVHDSKIMESQIKRQFDTKSRYAIQPCRGTTIDMFCYIELAF